MDKPSVRRLVVDRVLSALESLNENFPVSVNLEADGTLVVRATLGDAAHVSVPALPEAKEKTGGKRRGRPPGKVKIATAGESGPSASSASGHEAKIMEVLGKNPRGFNLKDLAKRVGVKQKTDIKPALKSLTRSKQVKKVGQLFRSADVKLRKGRKPGTASSQATEPAKPRRGRPPGSTNKQKESSVKEAAQPKAGKKRGPGRPKGSTNKAAKEARVAKAPAKSSEGRKKKGTSPARIAALEKARAAMKAKREAAAKAAEKKSPAPKGKKAAKKAGKKGGRKAATKALPPAKDADVAATPQEAGGPKAE